VRSSRLIHAIATAEISLKKRWIAKLTVLSSRVPDTREKNINLAIGFDWYTIVITLIIHIIGFDDYIILICNAVDTY